jgi:single-stranded DNA-specific DHH superfamily exonuclease
MKLKASGEKKMERVSYLIGNQHYGEALNALNELEKSDGFPKAKQLRIQLENILRYQHLDIYANTNLFMDPWLE